MFAPVDGAADAGKHGEGYFEETKIPHIKAGASPEIYLMDGSPALEGTVSGVARAVTDQDVAQHSSLRSIPHSPGSDWHSALVTVARRLKSGAASRKS